MLKTFNKTIISVIYITLFFSSQNLFAWPSIPHPHIPWCISHPVECAEKKAKELEEKLQNELEDKIKDGVTDISKLPKDLQDYVNKELEKAKGDISKLSNELKNLLNNKLNSLANNLKKKAKKLIINRIQKGEESDLSKEQKYQTKITSNRFANINLNVTNKATIISLGTISTSFKIGYKSFSKTFSVSIGDNSKYTWINSIKVINSSKYDINLHSTISGEYIFIGGNHRVASIIQYK